MGRSMLSILVLLLAGAASARQDPPWEALWERGARPEALAVMRQELDARPADAELRALLAARSFELRRFAAALEQAELLAPRLDALRGRALYMLARYEEALSFLDARDPEELRLRAECLRALGRLAEMEALIPAAEQLLGPRHAFVWLLRARAAERAGESREAARCFRAVLALAPLEAEARHGLGRALVRAGEREEGLRVLAEHRALLPLLDALDFAQRGVDLAPRKAGNQAALGDAWRALLPFDAAARAQARAAYERALELAAREELAPVALRAARWRHEDEGDLEGALALLERAFERCADARLLVRSADLLAGSGRRAEALQRLRAAAELRPQDAAVRARIEQLERRSE